MLYFSKLNSIYYYTFNDIKYLSDIDFKGQIRNSQKMVYLILGHPVRWLETYLKKWVSLGHEGTLPGPFLPRVLRN